MTPDSAGGVRRAAAILVAATLAVGLAWAITFIVGYSLVLGWIGIGLITLSLPVGPILAVAVTRRLFRTLEGPRTLPVVLGTWIGAALALTLSVFAASRHWPGGHLGALAVVVPGGFVGAIIGASLPARDGRTGLR